MGNKVTPIQERTYAQTKHGRTHYILEGDLQNPNAQLVVCVHGIGASTHAYESIAQEIVQKGGFKVLRYDLYSRGYSDPVHLPHVGDLFVEQLYELLVHLDLFDHKFLLIGHSMGGAVATLFTNKYPDMVGKLVLLTPAGLPWDLPFGSFLLGIPILGWIIFLLVTRFILTMEESIGENFFDIKHPHSETSIKIQLDLRTKGGMSNYTNYMTNSVSNFPLTGCTKEATCIGKQKRPTLIVWGQYDTTTPSDICFPQWYNLFKGNDGCNFVVVKDVRHNFFNEEIELSNKLISSWIRGEEHKNTKLIQHGNKNASQVILNERDVNIKRFWDENEHLFGSFMI